MSEKCKLGVGIKRVELTIEKELDIELRPGGCNTVKVLVNDEYVGFFGWNTREGVYFYSTSIKTDGVDADTSLSNYERDIV